MEKKSNLNAKVLHYCTIKNKDAEWLPSQRYETVSELFDAMKSYMEKYPTSTIQLLTETVYVPQESAQ